jgi:catechol 2,3-dioxygenase-like lactoylglutathione lyase family enzyme
MKLIFEIYTLRVLECKEFYTQHFNFLLKFEIEGFVVLQYKTNPNYELMFCVPNSPFVNPIFHPEFNGKGAIIQMEVENVRAEYERIKHLGLPIKVSLVNEPVNGYHFTIQDPSGLLIDIAQFK